jgi:hypothetical protein
MNDLFINYFESEYLKINIYKSKYIDKFSIYYNINTQLIEISRIDIDKDGGWGQDLHLLVHNKILHKNNIIKVGKSKNDYVAVPFKFNINDIKERYHYENENYKIFYISEKFNDIFKIDYNENDKLLIIKRIDSKTIEISELPVNKWTNDYKELLINMIDKNLIKTFKEFHTNNEIKFIINGTKEIFDQFENNNIKNEKDNEIDNKINKMSVFLHIKR